MRRMVRYIVFVFVSMIFILQCEVVAYSSEAESGGNVRITSEDEALTKIKEQLDIAEIGKYNSMVEQATADSKLLEGLSFAETVQKAITGELNIDFIDMLKLLLKEIFSEIYVNFSLMRNLIVIAILAALLRSITASFQSESVGEIGFYVCYIALVALLIASFTTAVSLASATIGKMVEFMQIILPFIMGLLISSGSAASSFVFHPVIVGAIELISVFIKDIILPVSIFGAMLRMINALMPKDVLENLSELIKNISGIALKSCAVMFMGVLSLQSISAPIINNFVNKGAKLAVNAVPVVGNVLTGAVDSVLYWSNAVKNGAAVAAIIFVIIICAAPIIKTFALYLIYKLSSAIMQPVGDERIVECIDSIAEFISIIIGALTVVAVMFIFMLMIVIAAGTG